jgi:acyl carrier protein
MSDEILSELTAVIREVFVVPDATIGRGTTALDVPGWDSIGHARLMLMIELAFSITFDPSEVRRPNNVGELADLIEKKLLGAR